jgi:hypothetical protein
MRLAANTSACRIAVVVSPGIPREVLGEDLNSCGWKLNARKLPSAALKVKIDASFVFRLADEDLRLDCLGRPYSFQGIEDLGCIDVG